MSKESRPGRLVAWAQGRPRAIGLLMALLSAVGLALYAPFMGAASPPPAHDLWGGTALALVFRALLGLGGGFLGARWVLHRLTAKRLGVALGIGALFALTCVAGMELQRFGTFRAGWPAFLTNAACWLGLWALGSLLALVALCYGGPLLRWFSQGALARRLNGLCDSRKEKNASRRGLLSSPLGRFFAMQLFLLLCWLPVWLAYCPGLANYDILAHVQQCATGQYETKHLILYTLLLKGCFQLSALWGGGSTLAVGLLCWLQMLLLSSTMAYALGQLRRHGAPPLARLLVLLFFGLFPVFPLLAISTTKDVPYAAFVLWLAVQMYGLFQNPTKFLASPKSCGGLVVAGVLMGLFRYNGILSLGLWVVGVLVLYRAPARTEAPNEKKPPLKLRLVALAASIVVLIGLGNQWLNTATQATLSGDTLRDMASVPSQQMVRAMQEMEPDSPEYLAVAKWYSGASMLHNYTPRLADYTKRYIDVGHDGGWRGFAETWFETGLHHPKAYVEAFLELNRGLWFVHDLSHTEIYQRLEGFGYLLNNQADFAPFTEPVEYQSLLPGLGALYDDLTTENAYLNFPLLRVPFWIGVQSWLSLLLFVAALYRRHRALTALSGWSLCLLVLLAVSPAVLVRYALPIFLLNPIGLLALWGKGEAGPVV